MIISVDPGKKVGIAWWKNDGTLVDNRVVSYDNFVSICVALAKEPDLDAVVVEQFILDHRADRQVGSKLEASRAIGAIELLCELTGAQLVKQPNTILRITAMHAGIKLGKGHIPDDVAAKLHGLRYFIERGVLKVRPDPVD